jgi:hypothetical protein
VITLGEVLTLAARLHTCILLANQERLVERAAICLEPVEFDMLLLDPHIAPYVSRHDGALRLNGIEITVRRPLTNFS